MHKKASDDDILNKYRETKSVWKTGHDLGLSGQSVWRRLQKFVGEIKNKWNEEEIKLLKNFYNNHKNKPIILEYLCKRIAKSKSNICCKARKLGLTNNQRPLSGKEKSNLSVKTKIQLEVKGHPRGMLGKKHSRKTLNKISINVHEALSRFSKDKRKEINKKTMDTRLMRYGKSLGFRCSLNAYSNGKRGKRKDLNNKYFRSSWEANYARYLNLLKQQGDIISWEYEPERFIFEKITHGTRSYCPDFKIITKNGGIEYHEVKGWLTKKGHTALKRMFKFFPEKNIILIDKKRYMVLDKQLKNIIPLWE